MKKTKKKEILSFKISDIEYENHNPIRKVYLGDKMIYKVDCTLLAGVCMREQTKDVMDVLSKELKRKITPEEFRSIKLLGIVEK